MAVMRSLMPSVPATCGGAAGQQVHDAGVFVIGLQRGTDAFVAEAHLDAVFLGIARREVVRMRIEGARVGVHQVLEHLVRGHLARRASGCARSASCSSVGGVFPVLAGERQAQTASLFTRLRHSSSSSSVVVGPGRLLTVELEGFLHRPVRFGVQQLDSAYWMRSRLRCWKRAYMRKARLHVAAVDHVVEAVLVLR